MNNNDLVAKLWKLCDNLRDGGVSYQNYVNELASLLFLKMCKETGQEADYLPEGYRWDDLKSRIGQEQLQFYRKMLVHLGEDKKKLVQAVFHNVSTTITEPKQITELVSNMDSLDWYSGTRGKSRDDFGDMYEGLLQKNANETKSGAGQYFTPRPLIKTIIHLLKPQPREVVQDPAAGTAGFLIEADRYVKSQTNDLDDLDGDTQDFQIHRAFIGLELVPGTRRLALMNCLLHDIEGNLDHGGAIRLGNTLGSDGRIYRRPISSPPIRRLAAPRAPTLPAPSSTRPATNSCALCSILLKPCAPAAVQRWWCRITCCLKAVRVPIFVAT